MRRVREKRRRTTLEGYHWALWALDCREGVKVGFPSQSNLYSPPRRGEIDEEPAKRLISAQDIEMVDRMLVVIADLRAKDFEAWDAVREYYGAYPGAILHRGDRLQLGILRRVSRSALYRRLNRGVRFVERHFVPAVDNDPSRIAA